MLVACPSRVAAGEPAEAPAQGCDARAGGVAGSAQPRDAVDSQEQGGASAPASFMPRCDGALLAGLAPPRGGVVRESARAAAATALQGRPASFPVGEGRAVFADVRHLDYELVLDATAASQSGSPRVSGVARVELELSEAGYPVLDLLHPPRLVRLDGCPLDPSVYAEVALPDGLSKTRVLQHDVGVGRHTLEVHYDLERERLPFRVAPQRPNAAAPVRFPAGKHTLRVHDGRVDALLALDDYDVSGRGFLERYAPASFEYDQHSTTLRLRLVGAAPGHLVMTNAHGVRWTGEAEVELSFPEHFASSSPFVHVVHPSEVDVEVATFRSVDGREVPITIYAERAKGAALASVLAAARLHLSELEGTFGPYLHPSLVIYFDGDDAMEYAGAVHASATSLRHELAHQWFGRGVTPADGQAGWIDEAITYWVERNYPRKHLPPGGGRPSLPLATHYSHQRFTMSTNAMMGVELISGLDGLLAPHGGLKPVLRQLVAAKGGKTLSVPDFLSFLRDHAPRRLHGEIERYFHAWGYDALGVSRLREEPGARGAPAPASSATGR